jgi:hypothetical protein
LFSIGGRYEKFRKGDANDLCGSYVEFELEEKEL